jgi:hypothetical protein
MIRTCRSQRQIVQVLLGSNLDGEHFDQGDIRVRGSCRFIPGQADLGIPKSIAPDVIADRISRMKGRSVFCASARGGAGAQEFFSSVNRLNCPGQVLDSARLHNVALNARREGPVNVVRLRMNGEENHGGLRATLLELVSGVHAVQLRH